MSSRIQPPADESATWLQAPNSKVGALIQSYDWASTHLGPVESWPHSLKTTVTLCLNTLYPASVTWGPDNILLYNDAASVLLGAQHPAALGKPVTKTLGDAWHALSVIEKEVHHDRDSVRRENQPFTLARHGHLEESYFTCSSSPIIDEEGLRGIFTMGMESTALVLNQRRLSALQELTGLASTSREVADATMTVLGGSPRDISFALFYMLDDDGQSACLRATSKLERGTAWSPVRVEPDGGADDPWSVFEVLESGQALLIEDLPAAANLYSPWKEPTTRARVLPLAGACGRKPFGALVLGLSPRLIYDADYASFTESVANRLASTIFIAQELADERQRTVSARKQFEEALLESEERFRIELLNAQATAEEIDKLKRSLLSNLSHEIRTPLTSIMGMAEVLAKDVSAKHRDAVTFIEKGARRLADTLNSLLILAQLEGKGIEPNLEAVNIVDAVETAAQAFWTDAKEKDIYLKVRAPKRDLHCELDPELLSRILCSVIGNAIKFTDNGGVSLSVVARPENVEIIVRDTGIGINDSFLPHLFDDFQQESSGLDRSHEGSGLGLAISQRLVQALNGSMTVTSVKDKGTTFKLSFKRLLLPVAQDAAPRGAVRPTVVAHTPNPRPRVLVVEDNDMIRELLETQLKKHFHIDAFCDAESGLASAVDVPYDVVLMDISLPGIDGIEATARLRQIDHYADRPIIAITGHAKAGDVRFFQNAGFTDHAAKPFTMDEVVTLVRRNLAAMAKV